MRLIHISAAILVLILCAIAGWTTTVVRMDLPALVQESDSIVQGQVEGIDSRWDEQKRTIFTYISVRVHEPLKANPGPTVVIRQLGGKVGAMRLSVMGMPAFRTGEEVILFLKRNPESTYHVVGLNQGKYEIGDDSVVANALGVELVDRKSGQVIEGGVNREQLATFKSRIRELVK